MRATNVNYAQLFGGHSLVKSVDDLQYLIKVCESATGALGRYFLIFDDNKIQWLRLTYDGTAYGMADASSPSTMRWLREDDLLLSPLGMALRAGGVFAPEVAAP